RAHRGCQGRDRLDRQEPQASGPQEVGGAALRRGYYLLWRVAWRARPARAASRRCAPRIAPKHRILFTPPKTTASMGPLFLLARHSAAAIRATSSPATITPLAE